MNNPTQTLPWMLFLDDERFPAQKHQHAHIARSMQEAVALIEKMGPPNLISFDHDLGDNIPTGFDVAKYLVEKDLDQEGGFLPPDFSYLVHSANNVGEKNIRGLLDPYLEYRKTLKAYGSIKPLSSAIKRATP